LPAAGDTLVFPNGASNPNTVNDTAAGTTYAAIQFTGPGFTLGGNAVTLTGGVTIDPAVASGTDAVNLPVTLAADQTFTAANTGTTLTVGGPVALGTFTLTLTGQGDFDVTGAVAGAGGLTKTGTGRATLSGANTYAGQTQVTGGTLRAAS